MFLIKEKELQTPIYHPDEVTLDVVHKKMFELRPTVSHPPSVAPVTPYSALLAIALDRLKKDRKLPKGTALDLCCGSGILAIQLAKAGYSSVAVTDIVPEAIDAALNNFKAQGLKNKIRGLVGDLWTAVPKEKFSLVVCNPPALPVATDVLMAPEQQWFDGGNDGRRMISQVIAGARAHLTKKGFILLAHSSLVDFDLTVSECTQQKIWVEPLCYMYLPFRDFYFESLHPNIFDEGLSKGLYHNGDSLTEKVWVLLLKPHC